MIRTAVDFGSGSSKAGRPRSARRHRTTRHRVPEVLLEPLEQTGDGVEHLLSEPEAVRRDRHILVSTPVSRHVRQHKLARIVLKKKLRNSDNFQKPARRMGAPRDKKTGRLRYLRGADKVMYLGRVSLFLFFDQFFGFVFETAPGFLVVLEVEEVSGVSRHRGHVSSDYFVQVLKFLTADPQRGSQREGICFAYTKINTKKILTPL